MRNRGAEVRRRLRDGSRAARDPVGIEAKAQSDRTVAVSRSTRTGVLSADQHGGGHRTAHVMQGPAGRINGDLRLLFARVRTPPGAPVTWRFEHRGAAGTGINRHQASVRLLHQLLHVAQGCNRPDRAPRPRTLAWYGPRHRRGTRDALRAGRGDPRGRLRHCDDRDRRIALWWVSLSSPSAGHERRTRDSVTQEWRGRSGAAPICTTPSPRGARAASCASTSAVVMSARLRLPPTRNVARPEPRSVRRCA